MCKNAKVFFVSTKIQLANAICHLCKTVLYYADFMFKWAEPQKTFWNLVKAMLFIQG